MGPAGLLEALSRKRLAVKAALLDQGVVAGLGNIYVDELLFGLGLHPLRRADTLTRQDCERVVRRMRSLLNRAIAAGGSSVRDYVDAEGAAGGFQLRHRAYGRAGLRCTRRCGGVLVRCVVAGRGTVFCPRCQAEAG